MSTFAVSVLAFRRGPAPSWRHAVFVLEAADAVSAERDALREARELFPPLEGWAGFDALALGLGLPVVVTEDDGTPDPPC